MPGQILMAPPSLVPAADGLACYGPVTGTAIAGLPAAYLAAWTPPREPTRTVHSLASVPPGRGAAAASYVDARINGIPEDLAAREPGGRNTAIYTAALKVGSTLGAARSTPGAEQAAEAWTDQGAEHVLMTAAEQNGYIADHSAAEARAAIRSGLRNGLRNPRPLPDFSSRQNASAQQRQSAQPTSTVPPASPGRRLPAVSGERDAANRTYLSAESRHDVPVTGQDTVPEEAEPGDRDDLVPRQRGQAGAGDWHEAVVQEEREEWQPAWSRDVAAAEPAGRAAVAPRASHGSPDWRDTVIGKQRQAWQPQVAPPGHAVLHPAETSGEQIST